MNSIPAGINVDSIISEYGIDVDSTSPIIVKNLKASTNVFRVERPDLIENLYLVDTVSGKDIACHPHIVGNRLKMYAFDAAVEAVKAISQLTDISKRDLGSIVVENVLRAGPGYELHAAFKKMNNGRGFRDVWIHPCYEKPSYRDHDEGNSMALNTVYENFEMLPPGIEVVVLKPDTEATGKTGKKSIERLIKRCEDTGSRIEEIILYGFISIIGLKTINETAKKADIRLAAFSIGNITDLAHNRYDMTLYGVDESYWRAKSEIRKLGSIIDIKSLERYLPMFVPGSDQPGDWSNRQTEIFITKEKKEQGEIKEHLQNSINLIESLIRIGYYTLWQKRIAKKELKKLHAILQEHRTKRL